jgi:hypothetical protein
LTVPRGAGYSACMQPAKLLGNILPLALLALGGLLLRLAR